MSETRRIQPITRIRAELQPASPVTRAVNRFLEKPLDERTARLYTTAQAVVGQGEHRTRHASELSRMERALRARSLAQRAFVLAPPLGLQERPDGSGRLYFGVASKNQRDLKYVGDSIRSIEGLEESDNSDLLYMEFAKGALARNKDKRRDQVAHAQELLGAELRHPSAKFRMTASGLHIVTRDMMYPVRPRADLPLAE